MLTKITLATCTFILLAISPFLFTVAFNEYRLWNFAGQLDLIQNLLPKHSSIIADGSQIFVGGNDEACSYRATKIFFINGTLNDLEQSKQKILALEFEAARDHSEHSSVELNISSSQATLVISIEDGPYSAGFDFRCW